MPGVRLIGKAADKTAVVSFIMEGIHAHDVGTIVDSRGIAVRTGHHCAMPVMDYFGVPATARASMAFYNTPEEIEKIADVIPIKRFAETSEIAGIVVFLCSDLNTYLTGQNIVVDGGYTNV